MAIRDLSKYFLYVLSISVITAGCASAGPGNAMPDRFGIYTARLNGKDVRLVVSNATQQMTHPRVSPDGTWITFTRYTKRNRHGLAMEKGGYKGTEIMLVRLDGSGLRTIVPAKKGILNCNSTWADGGRSLVWLSTDNPKRKPVLLKLDLKTRKVTRVPTPPRLNVADPHVQGDKIVFPVVLPRRPNPIWMMGVNGRNPRQVSHPRGLRSHPRAKHAPGDYDPKLSPDQKKVAFMRLSGRVGWKIIVADVRTGEERNLSGPGNIDALPDWSSDGRLLLFWHVDKQRPRRMGVYTMRPDGSHRRMVPLPRGYLHGHPHFFPDSGSSRRARIIYQATRAPKLP